VFTGFRLAQLEDNCCHTVHPAGLSVLHGRAIAPSAYEVLGSGVKAAITAGAHDLNTRHLSGLGDEDLELDRAFHAIFERRLGIDEVALADYLWLLPVRHPGDELVSATVPWRALGCRTALPAAAAGSLSVPGAGASSGAAARAGAGADTRKAAVGGPARSQAGEVTMCARRAEINRSPSTSVRGDGSSPGLRRFGRLRL
jgi:hypothetical protein